MKIQDKNQKTFVEGDKATLMLNCGGRKAGYSGVCYILAEVFKDTDGFGSWKLLKNYGSEYKTGDIIDYPLHPSNILKVS